MSTPGLANPSVLALRDVSKAFGAVRALREVSIDCRAGEIHALVGEIGRASCRERVSPYV